MPAFLGLDIGSISINGVVLDENGEVRENHYRYCHGRPFIRLHEVLQDILTRYRPEDIAVVGITGTGGELAARLIGGTFVNEIVAQSTAVQRLHPEAKTVIEMGGEDSKLLFMEPNGHVDKTELSDFEMNSMCAAGTGSFLDQQAKRIGVSIEEEFGRLALQSEDPPRIAGRCSVFAKSDMIHLQQIATPVHDIVAGLCFAVARNFKSTLGKGKQFKKPVIFQGGVAANEGVVRAFREILDLKEGEFIIPQYHASMGAIGAVYHVLDQTDHGDVRFTGLEKLEDYLESDKATGPVMEQLQESAAEYRKEVVFNRVPGEKLQVYLGIDVGSLSTNIVLIDEENNVVARRYLPTASKPIEAIRRGLSEIEEEVGDDVAVRAVGTTGSGRYLTGDFVGADTIQNEITAQAVAAITHDPTVDTIFEIGGQDSKYVSIQDGVVVDFEMNKVCAAGTGSFLEEQAEKLDINIIEEFGDLALNARHPAKLGDRCTVFMESDLNSHQQKGVKTENLVGGLAYSIVQNYIQKLVGEKKIGNKIFFQGGVTNNKAVVAAFEKITGKPITVPPHFDVTGAIGAAILAKQSLRNGTKTRFKGFDISKIPYSVDKFTCKGCANHCEIRRVRIEGEKKPLYYGGRCEKYEVEERKGKGKDIPNYFEERLSLLLGDYTPPGPSTETKRIGIPRGLMLFYQQFPFWRTFFEALGVEVVLSDPTDRQKITQSLEMVTTETCFPVTVIHGHVKQLLEQDDVDYVFIPFIINNKVGDDNPTVNYNCPWVQTYSFMIKAALKDTRLEKKILNPALHFRHREKVLLDDLDAVMKEAFGIPRKRTKAALEAANEAQMRFEEQVEQRGREILADLPEDKQVAVILGRPYNTGDPELNLNLVRKMMNLDVVPIPVDFLPLGRENIFGEYPLMYWPNGRKILEACRIIARDDRLNAVHMGNFRCGPDSFIAHYVREEMRGKPYLQLEIDEHSADAGMITRLEAFLDSLRGYRRVGGKLSSPRPPKGMTASGKTGKVLYFPYMRDNGEALAAASRSCGVEARVLPMQDEKDIEIGRKYTSSRECFPMICTTGNFIRKIMEPGFDPKRSAFFMPDHNGPCRFGQYNRFQRMLFDRLGYEDVEIVSPSNDDAYEGLSGGHGNKFRIAALRGLVAVDLLRKLQQERRPYEKNKGEVDRLYREALDAVVKSIEEGARQTHRVLRDYAVAFDSVPLKDVPRKPVVAVVGEIFMRDNPFCSNHLVEKLEALGAETVIAPMREWITYSQYRYARDSRWKGDPKGLLKAKIQNTVLHRAINNLDEAVEAYADMHREVPLEDMLDNCGPYIHRDYDGDPALNIGTCARLYETGISGVANILPFTCMPGTLVSALSNSFRKDHDNIPWVNIAYDGQQDTNIDTRLQAFMHQVREYAEKHGLNEPVHSRG
jgi:predicted CoA-substrate-specific enzyme activase